MNIDYVKVDDIVFVNEFSNLEKRKNIDNIDEILYQENYVEYLYKRRCDLKDEIDYEKQVDKSSFMIKIGFSLLVGLNLVLGLINFYPSGVLEYGIDLLKLTVTIISEFFPATLLITGIVKKNRTNNYINSLEKERDFLLDEYNKEENKLKELRLKSKEVSISSRESIKIPSIRLTSDFELRRITNFLYGGKKKRFIKLYKNNKLEKIKQSDEAISYIKELAKEDIKVLSKKKK